MNLAARRSLDARRIQRWSRGRRREHVVEDGRWKGKKGKRTECVCGAAIKWPGRVARGWVTACTEFGMGAGDGSQTLHYTHVPPSEKGWGSSGISGRNLLTITLRLIDVSIKVSHSIKSGQPRWSQPQLTATATRKATRDSPFTPREPAEGGDASHWLRSPAPQATVILDSSQIQIRVMILWFSDGHHSARAR
ncbi:predicted protein [Chaetomium globosum CBS 148.51]|uniref:Uncharacterized protein n=1 Tax=Chaetomium globosum (strain ATCC 6205 / CBS 148.51 / DSM 1962 / NBRC 6347 / NRRL 1970) TaxID=306901 RepID=Q2H1A8_CHAGB|nr:uncharacterized protein CHGG_04438 [Chaetomium globosum CBS 148.51]EAQ87819.1 predicted protein [Chaetomium globosum CBS 148.51]